MIYKLTRVLQTVCLRSVFFLHSNALRTNKNLLWDSFTLVLVSLLLMEHMAKMQIALSFYCKNNLNIRQMSSTHNIIPNTANRFTLKYIVLYSTVQRVFQCNSIISLPSFTKFFSCLLHFSHLLSPVFKNKYVGSASSKGFTYNNSNLSVPAQYTSVSLWVWANW